MSALSAIKDDRKLQLLEKRLNSSDQSLNVLLSPEQHPNYGQNFASPVGVPSAQNLQTSTSASKIKVENLQTSASASKMAAENLLTSASASKMTVGTNSTILEEHQTHADVADVNLGSAMNSENVNPAANIGIVNSSSGTGTIHDVVVIDGDDSKTNCSSSSRSRQGTNKENNSGKRKSDGGSGITEGKSPKLSKGEDEHGAQDAGSRGAMLPKRTILSYFPVQGEHHTLAASVFPNNSSQTASSGVTTQQTSAATLTSHPSSGDLGASPGKLGSSKDTASKRETAAAKAEAKSIVTNGSSTSTVASSSGTGTGNGAGAGAGGGVFPKPGLPSSMTVPLEFKKQLESARMAKDQAEAKILRLDNDLKLSQERCRLLEERNTKLCKSLEEVHRASARQEMRKRRDCIALDCVRLGKIVAVRMGPATMIDVWEEGYASNDLKRRITELGERKEEFEKRRKRLANLKRAAKRSSGSGMASAAHSSASAASSSSAAGGGGDDEQEGDSNELDLDLAAESEAIRSHLEQLKKDEIALVEERRMLDGEKAAHQKELKRIQSEDKSRFTKHLECLNSRYLLLSMLGKGGFSEVWKALDLVELREVAVKVHELNNTWSEEHKQRYIKNVTREYKIHREMRHPRVVEFYDVFEIDVNSFATVLEYCRGIDLDEKLKRCRTLPEREARTILMQIVTGLRYLNTPGDLVNNNNNNGGGDDDLGGGNPAEGGGLCIGLPRRKAIIHYDLKPANILFDEMGDAKITDFGLSKIIDDTHDGTSVENTSKGAGTYWYLPPECFSGDNNTKISSKVDVWSVGVIFYQMLFGKRPFGEGKSQERILSEGIMLNANQVEFPTTTTTTTTATDRVPKIPEEAKDFIRACLTPEQLYRPDVMALCQHSYLKNGK